MNGSMWENQYRNTTICIDSYENGTLSGRMFNPYLPEGDSFHSIMDFLKKMESMLNNMKFPQSYSVKRVFCPVQEMNTVAPSIESTPKGACGTFNIKVLFRQNASWQGSVFWIEGGREESFRSVLELLLLMDSALCAGKVESA